MCRVFARGRLVGAPCAGRSWAIRGRPWAPRGGTRTDNSSLPLQEAPRRPQEAPKRAQEAPWTPHEGPKRLKRGLKRHPNGPQGASKLPPRGHREASHNIQTNIQEASNPQPRHGGGMGQRPLDLGLHGTERAPQEHAREGSHHPSYWSLGLQRSLRRGSYWSLGAQRGLTSPFVLEL